MGQKLLEIRNLCKAFGSKKKQVIAVSHASISISGEPASTLAIVGESGSGKSTLANMVLGFTKPTDGEILYCGKDISKLSREEYSNYRQEVQAVFQNPFDAYNPFYPVDHVFDQVFAHFNLPKDKKEQHRLVEEKLRLVKLNPDQVLGKYAYQMSGGQLQRLMIARALLLHPKLLVADEPVSMIDASLRVTVLEVMVKLKKEMGISQLYITHDLSTALQISDDIIVMYKGHIVESGKAEKVIMDPAHPYTQLLINCIPIASPSEKWTERLAIEEDFDLHAYPNACCFADRCPYREEKCLNAHPEDVMIEENHCAACYRCRKEV